MAAGVVSLGEGAVLFNGAYRVDPFSQVLKMIFACGFALMLLAGGEAPRHPAGREAGVQPLPHYQRVRADDAGELHGHHHADHRAEVSAMPALPLVPMRREREGHRGQMESAIKYMMFGMAANGIMLFGMSYLFGLTGTISLPEMAGGLEPLIQSPVAIAGLAMMLRILLQARVFPFHFWTPDVYKAPRTKPRA